MSTSSSKGSDILIAVGAVLCIALGATVTYGLTHHKPAPDAADNKPVPTDAKPTGTESDFLPVSFATLSSYNYELPAEAPTEKSPLKEQIPQPIKQLSGKKVAVQGFMVPIDLKGGKTTKFLLVKDQSLCCFGRTPRMNEWVSIRMNAGKAARVIQDQPVTVFGNLEVGEVLDNGEVLSIYRLDSDDVAGPLDL